MTYAVLCSGNLGFNVLFNLHNNNIRVKFVLTDNKSTEIINFCERNNILLYKGNPREGRADNFIADNQLNTNKVDVLISVNYLYIIENQIIDLASKIAFNVHGSLLPKYRGRTPHVWSIINNEKNAGITAHVISEGCDEGDIIEQVKVRISPKETGASLLEKYNSLYFTLVQKVIDKIKSDNLILKKQDHSKATFFGKRTPDDGEINWDWQKERIYNWVRAQTYPYPGAFTFLRGKKIIIDEVRFNNLGFNSNFINGKILSLNPIIVKVQNGCIEIVKYRENIEEAELNDVFEYENK